MSKHNRLIRLVDDLPAPYACKLDAERNILLINRPLFDTLPPKQQQKLWRSNNDITYTTN